MVYNGQFPQKYEDFRTAFNMSSTEKLAPDEEISVQEFGLLLLELVGTSNIQFVREEDIKQYLLPLLTNDEFHQEYFIDQYLGWEIFSVSLLQDFLLICLPHLTNSAIHSVENNVNKLLKGKFPISNADLQMMKLIYGN